MMVRTVLLAGCLFCLRPAVVQAGMPSVSLDLTQVAQLRLQSISFFLMVLLLSAFILKLCWNLLAKDFSKLPRISYKGALGVSVLWGLMFLFVLTMISGARELLTPGAWEKTGRTYQLVEDQPPDGAQSAESGASVDERRRKLGELRSALFMHVATHQGKFPDKADETTFADEFWLQPGSLQVKYGYVSGTKKADPPVPLAFEQAIYGDDQQLILYTDGAIKVLPTPKAQDVLNGK
ncbi:hypothetical protein Enr10x_01520 [Gimesia panareensis]|uniref:Uncharacterized protein n=1 Tax=Gimesia panareensis TaxID=2527978 RepID=A0A517PZQ7_9PLAN|nr:hypothetical protein [Gimesia panareensis]QDT24860.1 hypothetical protein Enr10x_01520 [Gimesia panareensis]